MNRIQQLEGLQLRFRNMLRDVYTRGIAHMSHHEIVMCLGRDRATKGFHDDIEAVWRSEMELFGHDGAHKPFPKLRYAWMPGSNIWIFVWFGTEKNDELDWKII